MQMDFRTDQRHATQLSPRQQHAVRLLQMSSLDFGLMVRDTMGRNPFLAPDDTEPADTDGEAFDEGEGDEAEGAPVRDESLDETESDRDLWHADPGAGTRQTSSGDGSVLDQMEAGHSLTMHLHDQLNTLAIGPGALTLMLAHALVESLDDDGYLRTPLGELLDLLAPGPTATLGDMEQALKLVQTLEPAGVGARTVAECLELQLHEIACADMRALAHGIVTGYLEALAARDVVGMARGLGASPARIEAVCACIRRLHPHPGWRWDASRTAYVVPDVIVRKIRGEWSVALNPAILPRVKLDQTTVDLFRRHRTAHNAELGAHLTEAHWTLRNVEQRFSTILDVTRAIVTRQRHFLDFGPMAMKPLGLREIADEIGVHESTVSRVTNNKYMATARGVFELKQFFSRVMPGTTARPCSGTAIRGLVQELILAEPDGQPLSDPEITRQLAEQGLIVARRTVTKYRQELRIDAVAMRRAAPPQARQLPHPS